MKNFFKLVKVTVLCIVLTSCNNNDDTSPTAAYTNAKTMLQETGFNGYAIITKNGEDVVREGFGLANTETGLQQNNTLQYRIGSVSKTLTAAGVIMLQRQGLITSLAQPLTDFDPEFPNGNQITIAQLLSHQSGIPDYLSTIEPLAVSNQMQFVPEDIYEYLKESIAENGLLFTPGTQKQYSNSNFLIAALLIQEVSGMSYHQYITQHILSPLELNNTNKGTNEVNTTTHARGYQGTNTADTYPMAIAFGAGDWSSTPTDMENWVAAVKSNFFTETERQAIFATDVPEGYTDFGLGWFTSQSYGTTMYWHGGDINGFWSLIGFIPSSNATIVLLSNHEGDANSSQRNTIIEKLTEFEF